MIMVKEQNMELLCQKHLYHKNNPSAVTPITSQEQSDAPHYHYFP